MSIYICRCAPEWEARSASGRRVSVHCTGSATCTLNHFTKLCSGSLNHFTKMCSGSEADSCSRLIDSCKKSA